MMRLLHAAAFLGVVFAQQTTKMESGWNVGVCLVVTVVAGVTLLALVKLG